MRVCFVSPFAYGLYRPESKALFGGAEVDLYFIATALAKQPDFHVSVVTGDFGQPAVEHFENIQIYRSFRTGQSGLRRAVYALFVAAPKLWSALTRVSADVYVQEGAGFETMLTAVFCRIRKRKFVYRVASTVECTGEFVRMFPLVGRAFLYGLRRAHAIVTEDQEEVDLLKTHYGLAAQAIYDTTPIPPESSIMPHDRRLHILWVSRLVPMKRPEIFLDLAQAYPNEQFVMIAPHDQANATFASTIQDRAASLTNVQFIPGLPPEQLEPFYQRAQLFINTSDFEGYPNTFIEAGKYAVPILSLRVNPDHFFDQRRFGECAEGDQDRLIKILGAWLQDAELRQATGQSLSQHVRETSDMNKNIRHYVELFHRIAR